MPQSSWVTSANNHSDFPLHNLPFGVFRRSGSGEQQRVGVAIGNEILDISACMAAGLPGNAEAGSVLHDAAAACSSPVLNPLMSLGAPARKALREALTLILSSSADANIRQTARYALVSQSEAELFLPVGVGDYTDFYASVHHATNVGSLFRPDNPLLPNYKWVPIGYHGRASSIVVSGTDIRRPVGQKRPAAGSVPDFGPSRMLDYELELGAFVGTGNEMGSPIPMAEAETQIWGYSLLNDWSARDIQSWEYQPLGPFLAKNFATTLGAWVVTPEALEPFRAPLNARAEGDPSPLPYLLHASDQLRGGLDVTLEVWLSSARMRETGEPAVRLSRSSCLDLYWTFAQMLAHHSSGGCNLRPGDLLGSGTISGPAMESRGCLLEITRRGAEPVSLPTGETRAGLESGDEIALVAFAQREGVGRIGFGRCIGRVVG